jgi:hypothetical protein
MSTDYYAYTFIGARVPTSNFYALGDNFSLTCPSHIESGVTLMAVLDYG